MLSDALQRPFPSGDYVNGSCLPCEIALFVHGYHPAAVKPETLHCLFECGELTFPRGVIPHRVAHLV